MTVRISVVVATYGPTEPWAVWAERAAATARNQDHPAVDVTVIHGETLHEARNEGAERAAGDWLVFLDADDYLNTGYLRHMAEAVTLYAGTDCHPLLVQPATRGWTSNDGGATIERLDSEAVLIRPRRSLIEGNHLVVGTLVNRAQFLRVGGFADWPAWEDWELWLRCWIDGARIITNRHAEYLVQVRPDGRNSTAAGDNQLYRRIRAKHEPMAKARGLIR